ncbi:hypothetical protein N2152v2_011292 [Parachlorella kessleri]
MTDGGPSWNSSGVFSLNATHNATLRRYGNLTREEWLERRHEEEEELKHALLVFYLVLVTLLGLWLIPPVICLHLGFWRFIAVWVLYSSVTLYYLYACSFKKLDKTLPKKVYRWFLGVFRVSIAVGFCGYVLLILEIFGIGMLLRPVLSPVTALVAVWYGLYYGILSRDSAEVASDRIASMMGSGRKLAVSVRDCAICGGELQDGLGLQPQEAPAEGWTIVGKKDVCPACYEKVDLRALYSDRPWETRNLSWIQMLDMVRYLVVWNPVILIVLHFAFHLVGLDNGPKLGEHAALHNSTLLSNATGIGLGQANATQGVLHAFL